ncbi:DNA/RNA helicase domain-containing protein [Salinisphaera orenii]|uniref:DNA/RNA helicase domain-containing protein n=1 Tax=Salinisphaera orenii TaxID=856731 RepID=UPI000F4C7638|nr:DNA/RNA helicase domain-containing protein [Salinisphaera orenii]
MLLTVAEYKNAIEQDLDSFIHRLQDLTGRQSPEERNAWQHSLPVLAEMLSAPALNDLHLFFAEGAGHVDVEYQLPATASWCDAVLLGNAAGRPSAVIIELKHWLLNGDTPGSAEGLINRRGRDVLHPSDQVRGYTEYCRRYHTAVQDSHAAVDGCVLFTRSGNATAYSAAPNRGLTLNYPIFTTAANDIEARFPDFLRTRVNTPDEEFAARFSAGGYRQERGFVAQIGQQLLDSTKDPFVLLENQRAALSLCRERTSRYLDERMGDAPKRVVIVEGPPGSGKSVVAAKLWAALVTDDTTREGDLVFTTTSQSQNSNWTQIFRDAAQRASAAGVVKKVNQYYPATTHDIGRLRRQHGKSLFSDSQQWRQNLRHLAAMNTPRYGAENDAYLVSLVDEAHALINPEQIAGRGQFGFPAPLGPQAFHVMRCSRLTVFFLDPEQGFRDRENTSREDIHAWARELDAEVETISLEDTQFRCAGSREYVEWLDSVFENINPRFAARNARRWLASPGRQPGATGLSQVAEKPTRYRSSSNSNRMAFEIFDTPTELEHALRAQIEHGRSARILASYSRPWSSRDFPDPHNAPAELNDFRIAIGNGQEWRRPWNYVPNNDYAFFVQARPGSPMANDPLCEVGCTYAVRGFDFDYVGILWMSDLVWRTNRWCVDPQHVHESGVINTASRARRERDPDTEARDQLLQSVKQAYRILLTRALRGVYLWIEDEETRKHLKQAVKI